MGDNWEDCKKCPWYQGQKEALAEQLKSNKRAFEALSKASGEIERLEEINEEILDQIKAILLVWESETNASDALDEIEHIAKRAIARAKGETNDRED